MSKTGKKSRLSLVAGATAAAAVAAAVALPATATARGVNCEVTGGGQIGVISFTTVISKNNCGFEVRGFVKVTYGTAGTRATQWDYGNTITGTGTSKAGFTIVDSPAEWGFQVYYDGSWQTYATQDGTVTAYI